MFTLNLLGGAVLHGRGGPVAGRAAHKRRLALLAILAAARGRTVGRERLIGLLWPEHPTDGARHLLSESLYVLRRELGEDAFVSAGDEVGLNAEVVRSDVGEFERAVEEGELEAAAKLYRGPFLDGFYVSDAPEFERWAEGERDRLARAFARAVECLAEAREGEGRPQEAAEWWKRLAVADPYNSRVGVRLMRALDAAGERAAALWFAETHTALLREELGVEPEDEFAALVERLRTEPVRVPPAPPPPPPPAASPPPPAGEVVAEPEAHAPSPDTAAVPLPPVPPETAPPAPSWPRRRWAYAAGALALAAAAASGLFTGGPPGGEAAPELDPHRIAVLYFDDHSPGGELGYLASGLTEMLIHDLSQVEALDVVSRNGVKPYRDRPVRFDSMAADLRAGTVVEGSVQRSGDRVRVTVQLIDANSESHLESRTIVHPMADLFALEDALAGEVAGFLRRRLGREVRLRQVRAETRSADAWRRVLQAEEAREDAARMVRDGTSGDAASARWLLARADSLLARAERDDPRWTRPTVLRGWVAHARASLAPPADAPALHGAALGHAARVLAREPANARALELAGTVRFRLAADAAGGAPQEARLDSAERDLRAALAAEPALAGAWSRLSQLLRFRGRHAESDRAARRALAADAYLEDADDILHRLYFGALFLGDYREARGLCGEGRRRFPADWRFTECALTLLREDRAAPADPDSAGRLLAALDRMDPPERARAEGRGYTPAYRLAVAAAVLARAGRTDSARAVLARARAMAGGDAETSFSLDYDEAYARLLLGERSAARSLLRRALAGRPGLRDFAAQDPLLRELLPAAAATGTPRAGGAPPRPPR